MDNGELAPLIPKKHERSSVLEDPVSPQSPCSTLALSLMCLVTGLTNITAFQSTKIWAGFMTGNTLQIGYGLPRLLASGFRFELSDIHQYTTVVFFAVGAFVGGALKRRFGAKCPTKREYLIRSLFECSLILVTAFALLITRNKPYDWSDPVGILCQGLLAASQGAQGVGGQNLSTEFATTVVQTSVWLAFASLPSATLFHRGKQRARDLRAMSILSLAVGGAVGCILIANTDRDRPRLGQATVLFLTAGIRLVASFGFMYPVASRQK